MRDRAGRKEEAGNKDKKRDNGSEAEEEGGWRSVNVPLWSMKRKNQMNKNTAQM